MAGQVWAVEFAAVKSLLIDLEAQAWATGRKREQRERLSEGTLD